MPKRLNKPILVRTRDENGNYITLNMSTGSRKINYRTNQSTSINKPRRKQNVKRTLKPGEQVFTDWRTGKKTVFTPRRTEVKSDNRSEYQKQEDQKTADILHQKHEQEKTTQEGLKNLEAIGKVISPSTYIGPLANRITASIYGDKQDRRPIGEQILSGEGTGDTAGNLLLDFASPYVFQKLPNATKQLYKAIRYANNKVLDNLIWYQRLPNGRYTMGEPVLPNKTITISESGKQPRLQLQKPTYQVYTGNKHKISEVIDDSGNVNLANLLKIQNEALSNVPGGRLARHRLENPDWHKTDWNTFLHSRDAYQRALQAGYPNEALFSTLMHDAGKLWAGDGHGPYGASIVKQIFPDATDEQIMAIYQHMDKVPESAMGKLVKGADIKEPNQFRTFKSELDWSPQSWFSKRADKKWTKQDEDALISHLQEYLDIEKKAKQNGTWLKNKDGSTFDGDPRSWVQMQSDSFKKSYNDEILTHGEDAINDLFGDFYGDGVGAGIGDKVLWTSTNKLLGKTYGNDVFSLAALKNAKTNIVADAEGRPWLNVVQGKDTNNLVYPNLTNDNIVRINNVVDVGPNIKLSEIKDFRKNETVPEYLSRKYTGDDVVIGQDVSRKSIVGNNGDFNPIDKNIYRALIPLISTYGLYDINKYNYNSGKDIRIKPSKRGTFTKAAKQHGMSVQDFANRVLRNPSKYSAAMRKKANFARNASKWNK